MTLVGMLGQVTGKHVGWVTDSEFVEFLVNIGTGENVDRVTSEHLFQEFSDDIRQITGDHVGWVACEYNGQVIGDHIGRVTDEKFAESLKNMLIESMRNLDQVTGEHVGQVTGD